MKFKGRNNNRTQVFIIENHRTTIYKIEKHLWLSKCKSSSRAMLKGSLWIAAWMREIWLSTLPNHCNILNFSNTHHTAKTPINHKAINNHLKPRNTCQWPHLLTYTKAQRSQTCRPVSGLRWGLCPKALRDGSTQQATNMLLVETVTYLLTNQWDT